MQNETQNHQLNLRKSAQSYEAGSVKRGWEAEGSSSYSSCCGSFFRQDKPPAAGPFNFYVCHTHYLCRAQCPNLRTGLVTPSLVCEPLLISACFGSSFIEKCGSVMLPTMLMPPAPHPSGPLPAARACCPATSPST